MFATWSKCCQFDRDKPDGTFHKVPRRRSKGELRGRRGDKTRESMWWEANHTRHRQTDRNLTTQSLASWNFSEFHTTRNTFPEILWGFDYHNRALEHETTTVTATRTWKKNWFLMGRIKAQRVRFQTMYISQPSSAKQQRETSKICLVCGHKPR